MKTKVRITHTDLSGGYKHLIIEILDRKYKYDKEFRKYPTLEIIGLIQWQGHYAPSDSGAEASGWYAPHIEIRADIHEEYKLLAMYKLMKYLRERAESVSPNEYLKIMEAEEYVYVSFLTNFVPLSTNGLPVFDLMQIRNRQPQCYTRLIAPNKTIAEKMAATYKLTGQTYVEKTDHMISIEPTKIAM